MDDDESDAVDLEPKAAAAGAAMEFTEEEDENSRI